MKVLVGHINAECNQNVRHTVSIDEFQIFYGEACLDAMEIRDIFEDEHIQLIPTLFARLHPNGFIQYDAFKEITNHVLKLVAFHQDTLDGIFLHLHGASGVVGLDEISLEHYLLKEIRKIVGDHLLIGVVMDPHGNVTSELTKQVNLVRCYRQSPHYDYLETRRFVAKKFVELIKNPRPIRPVFYKLPIITEGERSISRYEPVRSLNQKLDELEKDERILSASFHVGYIRQDVDKLGCAIVIVPNHLKDRAYAKQKGRELAKYVWNHKEEFKYRDNYGSVNDSVTKALDYPSKTVVITDSGDNCGAGSQGLNTVILREFLRRDLHDKKILFAGITDPNAYETLLKQEKETVSFNLGVNEDVYSKSISVVGQIITIGEAIFGQNTTHYVGKTICVRLNENIDVLVLNRNVQYGSMKQYEAANVHFHDYDIVVVKMGYLDVGLVEEAAYHIMALSPGPTNQNIEELTYKKIKRPIWPLDKIDELTFIDQD